MSYRTHETEARVPRGIINLQDRCSSSIMDVRTRKMITTTAATTAITNPKMETKKMELHRTYSQGNGRRLLPVSYFSLESLLLLICLTASLLLLPLILPPLPPPPFMLLLVPIGLLALLMILAFMPSNVRDITYKYV